MPSEMRQQWRDEWIDPQEKLREIRVLMRQLCDLPMPNDDLTAKPLEFQTVFRICQLIYGTGRHDYQHVPFLIMRLRWFQNDGELPDFVLRAHEMLLENGAMMNDHLRRIYVASVEMAFPPGTEDMDDESFFQTVGRHIAKAALRGKAIYAF